ncbi:helix-turn-helix transcriptional regulator [Streptomyces sp. NBC_00555]|uniref:helix-turn-helix domain-containing protein n=1 Tax=Streptomyces sp. NBC_00555 TaxID=2903662 RepID=UPI00224CC30E|nr:helix-turn-helix transcriptional regulator [Streptomyces sp. NBC_00555]MCX5015005.1 helix-turn-helix transcriptional regulator [Streptomyces sp. NBC_00555]
MPSQDDLHSLSEGENAAYPPFDPRLAVRVREQLGLTHGQVAWAVSAFRGHPLHPDVLLAWERGTEVPTTRQIDALAAALWCSPGDLLGEPATLLQCRTLLGLTVEQVATMVGMTRDRYAEAERRNRWRGSGRQTQALFEVLRPPPACFVDACGRTGQLRVLLREAVTGWWPNYVRPVAKIVPVAPAEIRGALEQLHLAYQRIDNHGRTGAGAEAVEREALAFLDRVDEQLWRRLRTQEA